MMPMMPDMMAAAAEQAQGLKGKGKGGLPGGMNMADAKAAAEMMASGSMFPAKDGGDPYAPTKVREAAWQLQGKLHRAKEGYELEKVAFEKWKAKTLRWVNAIIVQSGDTDYMEPEQHREIMKNALERINKEKETFAGFEIRQKEHTDGLRGYMKSNGNGCYELVIEPREEEKKKSALDTLSGRAMQIIEEVAEPECDAGTSAAAAPIEEQATSSAEISEINAQEDTYVEKRDWHSDEGVDDVGATRAVSTVLVVRSVDELKALDDCVKHVDASRIEDQLQVVTTLAKLTVAENLESLRVRGTSTVKMCAGLKLMRSGKLLWVGLTGLSDSEWMALNTVSPSDPAPTRSEILDGMD